jgi:hypothetical protein
MCGNFRRGFGEPSGEVRSKTQTVPPDVPVTSQSSIPPRPCRLTHRECSGVKCASSYGESLGFFLTESPGFFLTRSRRARWIFR